MSGIVAIRTTLVIALLITAHVIRPFSIRNVTQHLLYSTRSFAFVLPGETRAEFDTANDLALSLSDGFFRGGVRRVMEAPTAGNPDAWQLALKLVTLDGANRVIPAPRAAGKRPAPAKRAPRVELMETADLVAMLGEEETAVPEIVETPEGQSSPIGEAEEAVSRQLPIADREIAEWKVVPIAFSLPVVNATQQKADCRKPEPARVKLVAVTDGNIVRLSLRLAQLATVAPECDAQKPVLLEAEAPESTGPEAQLTGEFLGEELLQAEPQAEAPTQIEPVETEATESGPGSRPTLLKRVIR